MLNSNQGWVQFSGLVTAVEQFAAGLGVDLNGYADWKARRWSRIAADLQRLTETPRVDAFVSEYAASLARSLLKMLGAGAVQDAAEAAIDFAEDLVDQAGAASIEQPSARANSSTKPPAQTTATRRVWPIWRMPLVVGVSGA